MKILLRIVIFMFSVVICTIVKILMLPIDLLTAIVEEFNNAFIDKYSFEFKKKKLYHLCDDIRHKPRKFIIDTILDMQLWYNYKYYDDNEEL